MNEKLTFKDSQKVKKDVDASHVDKVLKRLSFISLVLVMFFLVVCIEQDTFFRIFLSRPVFVYVLH